MNRQQAGSNIPKPAFTEFSAIAVMVGIVIGVGIFRLPSLVAENAASDWQFIAFWVAGGIISFIGALCYAELASSYPDTGGEYYFLDRAFGSSAGFLFSWGRMTVIQTGSITLAAFILGDYASRLVDLGTYSSAIYAGVTVILLTGLNIWGTNPSRNTQNIVSAVIVAVLVGLAIFSIGGEATGMANLQSGNTAVTGTGGSVGLAMIFVLLTYGGWNEASYLTGEIKDVQKKVTRIFGIGIGAITLVYLLVNFAYLEVLGLEAIRNSEAVGADLTELVLGPGGSMLLSLTVIVAALSTANATIITGARTNFALGRDFPLLSLLGKWDRNRNAPTNALILQGIISLVLVFLGAVTEQAVATMAEYTAPVFWFFLTMIGMSLFVFRYRHGKPEDSFSVPLYPLTPLVFILTSLYMLYSSLTFTGVGALFGAGILAVGVPVLYLARKRK